jgi:hypothetical protein
MASGGYGSSPYGSSPYGTPLGTSPYGSSPLLGMADGGGPPKPPQQLRSGQPQQQAVGSGPQLLEVLHLEADNLNRLTRLAYVTVRCCYHCGKGCDGAIRRPVWECVTRVLICGCVGAFRLMSLLLLLMMMMMMMMMMTM